MRVKFCIKCCRLYEMFMNHCPNCGQTKYQEVELENGFISKVGKEIKEPP